MARLDRALNKIVPDQRITNAPGDSVEVQIAVRGKDVFLVWSDARANPDEGNGDIYLARLDAATLKKTGPEVRLFASATHSRTPADRAAGQGLRGVVDRGGRDVKGGAGDGRRRGSAWRVLDEKGDGGGRAPARARRRGARAR